ncbi:MAG: UvrD-helicase domain-containing protein [Paludibacteraceae bacterium]|nr:UvrD-helicase domain-containing protein [Paludibacteraceae bacterium]
MSNLLKGLNEQQKLTVQTTEGYVRVIAGAGTGKTKTLVHRFAYIVNELGVSPSNILCVTFTNKAAQEMKSRLRKLVDFSNVTDLICTYHGLCVKILREDIYRLGYPTQFIIADSEDQKALLKEVFEKLNIKSDRTNYKKVSSKIKYWKQYKKYIVEYISTFNKQKQTEFINSAKNLNKEELLNWQCFIEYLNLQKKGFILDFDDLIQFALYLLQQFPEVLQKWQNKLDYIMVDETQDNSTTQWELVDLLQGTHKNLFVVGDPDQCIYEWRGASPTGLISFEDNYSPCQTIILNRNYRSSPNILDVANSVISKNENRVPKDLYTTKEMSNKVTHFHGKTEDEEGDYIAKTILKHTENGNKLSDFAILYRSSSISRYIEQALVKNKLSYMVYGGIRFFERKEIKDILSYLRMLDSADDISFKRVINLPSRKLGKVFLSSLQEIADSEKRTLYETLRNHINEPQFNKTGAKNFIKLIENTKKQVRLKSLSDIANLIFVESGLEKIYRNEGDQDRLDNINELMSSIKLYENDNTNEDDLSLMKYLQDIALYTNLDYKKDSDFIKIMTIHQSKGLEFPIVFVSGLSEGIFPSHRTIRERRKNGLEEERRLAYVAYTRAEKELYLTESEGYNFEMDNYKFPSRFIFEIKSKLLVKKGTLSSELKKSALKYIQNSSLELKDNEGKEEIKQFSIGTLVFHKLFGEGSIISINDMQQVLEIKFDNGSTKHISIDKAMNVLSII